MIQFSESMRTYFKSLPSGFLQYYDILFRMNELEHFSENLRADLALTMVKIGKSKVSTEIELVSYICLDYALVQASDFLYELEQRNISNRNDARQFLSNTESLYRSFLSQFSGNAAYRLPAFLAQIDPHNKCNEYTTKLCRELYKFFSIMIKIDGDTDQIEISGFKEFWKSYKRLLELNPAPDVKQIDVVPGLYMDLGDTDPLSQFDNLVGISNIKQQIGKLDLFLKMQKMREKRGLGNYKLSLHSVFVGSPGTGKTTVARLYSSVLKHLGYLSKGHLIEADKATLVAGYVGQTAEKTSKIIESAIGGVLFIDEAYSLYRGLDGSEYGLEAIDILLNRMEKYRDDLVVIVAGYENEMADFLSANPGLASRFTRMFNFPDFNVDELHQILEKFLNKNQYKLDEKADELLKEHLLTIYANKQRDFGNARFIRNVFEKLIEEQCNRVADIIALDDLALQLITRVDVQKAFSFFDKSGNAVKF